MFNPIEGYNRKYFIGNMGTVKNNNGLIISPQRRSDKCSYVWLTKNGSIKALFLNTLLLTHFFKTFASAKQEIMVSESPYLTFGKASFYSNFNDKKQSNYTLDEMIFELEINHRL